MRERGQGKNPRRGGGTTLGNISQMVHKNFYFNRPGRSDRFIIGFAAVANPAA